MRDKTSIAASSKRGQTALDALLLIVVLFVVGIGFLYGYSAFKDLNDDIQADDDLSAEGKAAANSTVTQFPSWADNIMAFFLVMFWILMIVSSFLIDTHPAFFIVTVILLIFVFVVTIFIANAYSEISNDDDLVAYRASFPKITWIMDHLLMIIVVMSLSAAFALFAKERT